MAKIVANRQEFFELTPLVLLTALKNPEIVDDGDLADLLDDIELKIKPALRQYFRAIDPAIRQKLKFLIPALAGTTNRNGIITITPDKSNEENSVAKYLTENYQTPMEIARKYLGG